VDCEEVTALEDQALCFRGIYEETCYTARCERDQPLQAVSESPVVDITSGSVHLEVCWIDQPTSLPSGLIEADLSTIDLGGRTLPLVMSQTGDSDSAWKGKSRSCAWWYNRSPLS